MKDLSTLNENKHENFSEKSHALTILSELIPKIDKLTITEDEVELKETLSAENLNEEILKSNSSNLVDEYFKQYKQEKDNYYSPTHYKKRSAQPRQSNCLFEEHISHNSSVEDEKLEVLVELDKMPDPLKNIDFLENSPKTLNSIEFSDNSDSEPGSIDITNTDNEYLNLIKEVYESQDDNTTEK